QLCLKVARELSCCVATAITILIIDVGVPAGKRNWLEYDVANFVDILYRKTNNVTNRIIVHATYHCRLKRREHSGFGDVLYRRNLHLKQISYAAVCVLLRSCTVELQKHSMEPCLTRSLSKILFLCKANSVCCDVKSLET